MNTLFFETALGVMCAVEKDGALVSLRFADGEGGDETPLLQRTRTQILEYLDGKRNEFDIPLLPRGTDFQMRVWKCLESIPYGETRTYSQIAHAVGSPRACRAVGTACNRNPIAIIVPCHRVVGASGMLVGYAYGLDAKKYLLSLEKMY